MRVAIALLAVAVTAAAALYIHQRHITVTQRNCILQLGPNELCAPNDYAISTATRHPSWEDPVAVFLVLAGLASAAAITRIR